MINFLGYLKVLGQIPLIIRSTVATQGNRTTATRGNKISRTLTPERANLPNRPINCILGYICHCLYYELTNKNHSYLS